MQLLPCLKWWLETSQRRPADELSCSVLGLGAIRGYPLRGLFHIKLGASATLMFLQTAGDSRLPSAHQQFAKNWEGTNREKQLWDSTIASDYLKVAVRWPTCGRDSFSGLVQWHSGAEARQGFPPIRTALGCSGARAAASQRRRSEQPHGVADTPLYRPIPCRLGRRILPDWPLLRAAPFAR